MSEYLHQSNYSILLWNFAERINMITLGYYEIDTW